MDFIHKRIANLISVKSIVTILLTGVFGYLSIVGNITGEQFLSIFTVSGEVRINAGINNTHGRIEPLPVMGLTKSSLR